MFRTKSIFISLLFSLLAVQCPMIAAESDTQESLKVATGKATLSGLLQGWMVNDSTAPLLNFRLRRAELAFKGSVFENTRWFIMVDAAKALKAGTVATTNDNKILQDLGVAINLIPELEFMIGQFKTPTTFEGLAPTAELPLPERSLSGRTYGDKREPGFMLTYKSGIIKGQAMLSNGQSPNVDDTNDKKDLHIRAEVNVMPNLLVGAFATLGDFDYDKKGRFGGNIKFSQDALTIRAEAVRAKDNSLTLSTGYMADISYQLLDCLQPVARFDGINTEGTFTGSATTVGLNYLIFKHHARATLAYAHLNNMTGGGGIYTLSNNKKGDLIWFTFQAAI